MFEHLLTISDQVFGKTALDTACRSHLADLAAPAYAWNPSWSQPVTSGGLLVCPPCVGVCRARFPRLLERLPEAVVRFVPGRALPRDFSGRAGLFPAS